MSGGGEYGTKRMAVARKAERVKIQTAQTAHQCRQCRQHDDRFYCDPCLNSLLGLHGNEIARLTLARDKAQGVVHQLLGEADAHELPDPFDSHVQPSGTSLLLLRLVKLRAQVAASIERIQDVHLCISHSQQTLLKGKERLKEKHVQILQRKQNLAKAWSSLEGSSRAVSKLPAHVYSQYDSRQLGALIANTRLSVSALQREARGVTAQLKALRSSLVHQALSLYAVLPPTATASPAKRDELSASSVAQRFSKLSERYMPGAFVFTHDDAPRKPAGSANWTIAGLALPLPSEVRRHSREAVNGALAYTLSLLQLLAGYLGMALPFSLVLHKGKWSVRPDPLWDGGGGSSAKPLQLSSAAYTVLTAAATPSKLNNLAESTLGLGASTLSTIESYIQLPSSSSIPRAAANQRSLDPDGEPGTTAKPDQAAKAFVSGLVMLSYNVAYLASKQGVKVDLVTAASNPLQLLHALLSQPELGTHSHASHGSTINDLSMPQLDYDQLAQVLEPTDSAKKTAKRATPAPRRPHKILEHSYVDAGAAAASVLNIADPAPPKREPPAVARPSGRQLPTSSPPPASLTFLRQRGQATKPADAEQSAQKVGPGAVIFNGVEVGVGNVPADTPRRSSKARADVEEGWNLV